MLVIINIYNSCYSIIFYYYIIKPIIAFSGYISNIVYLTNCILTKKKLVGIVNLLVLKNYIKSKILYRKKELNYVQ